MPIKRGVKIQGWTPELVFGLQEVREIYRDFGVEFVVTSGVEGHHSETSLHYSGNAADIRTRHMEARGIDPEEVASHIRVALGRDFDCVVERTHIHVEYQPRR